MPICPRCNEEIDRLNYEQVVYADVMLDKTGDIVYCGDAMPGEIFSYDCPECFYDIAKHEEDAIIFLKGEQDAESEQQEELKRKVNNGMFG